MRAANAAHMQTARPRAPTRQLNSLFIIRGNHRLAAEAHRVRRREGAIRRDHAPDSTSPLHGSGTVLRNYPHMGTVGAHGSFGTDRFPSIAWEHLLVRRPSRNGSSNRPALRPGGPKDISPRRQSWVPAWNVNSPGRGDRFHACHPRGILQPFQGWLHTRGRPGVASHPVLDSRGCS